MASGSLASAAQGLKQGLLVQASSVILTLETKEGQGCVSGPRWEDLERERDRENKANRYIVHHCL